MRINIGSVNIKLLFSAFFPFKSVEYSHEKTSVAARKAGLVENMVMPVANRKKNRFTAG